MTRIPDFAKIEFEQSKSATPSAAAERWLTPEGIPVKSVYGAADLFVCPSLQDNLPLTVVEAMSCGTPVVGFDVGGIPDMVRPDVTGSLVPPGNVAALGAAIAKLLEDDPLRREMSANCRRVAVEEYALEVQARRYVELYERLLTGG